MFEIVQSKLGYIKLSDGSEITLRVSIFDIREGAMKPTGPDLEVGYDVRPTVRSSLLGMK